MGAAGLDDRSRDILKSLIQLHICTGEPIGSENLARALNRTLSPATLRNIMADLERLGYLEHPHTSAGRLPTDDGYRFYVDSLMAQPLPQKDAAAIESKLRPRDGTPAQVMENASHILSRLSRNVAFVLTPELSSSTFRHIDLVRLSEARVLVVLVSRTGIVTHKSIEAKDPLSQDDLQACANYLNANFAGQTLSAIRARLLELMSEEKAAYDTLLKQVVSVGEQAFSEDAPASSVFLDGTSYILDQSTFSDLDRLRSLFKTFEEKSRLVKILNACMAGTGVRILIGHENPAPDLADMAVVTASFPVDGDTGFGIGVMGSTRMEYPRVIALVEHVGRGVAQALKDMRS